MYSFSRVIKGTFWLFFGSPHQKRRMHQECARLAASMFGDFPISEDHKTWRNDIEFLENYRKLSPKNPYSQDRKYLLREFARFTQNINGAMAECGCYQGASAYYLAEEFPDTTLYLFDSFQGLSEIQMEDNQKREDNFSWKKGDMTALEEEVANNLSKFNNIKMLKGWIPERFDEVSSETFRLVHIDVDLYQPTLDSLTFFYERVNTGGVIILDDYGFTTCPGAIKAVDEFMSNKKEYVLNIPTGQGVIIKSD